MEKTKFCWKWTGFLNKNKSPVIRLSNVISYDKHSIVEFNPRRLSLELVGKTISPKEKVQLTCDNKLCVNPAHLVYGNEARFWNKVQRLSDDECWIWTAGQDKDMYGKFKLYYDGNLIDIRAHVYSWELFVGHPLPKNIGLQVCHKCDHPYCVNPHHLFIGTTQDNTKDRDEKGRQARGEKHILSKLTEINVKEIRELHKNDMSITQLSHRFQVGWTTIACAINGKTWKHVL